MLWTIGYGIMVRVLLLSGQNIALESLKNLARYFMPDSRYHKNHGAEFLENTVK